MSKLLIKGGKVVNADKTEMADVLCENGIITAIGQNLPTEGCEIVDAAGKLILPGGIDPHCHLDMPFMGTFSYDDFRSGSECALAGGTTMLIDFIIPGKTQSLVAALEDWKKKGSISCCDYSFHGCLVNWNDSLAHEMEILCEEGITSFKHFQAYKGALMLEAPQLRASFANCKRLGILPQVHAEDGESVFTNQREVFAKGVHLPAGHPLSRPPEVEGKAVEDAIALAHEVGCPLYVVHNTCAPAVDAIAKAQTRGQVVIAESVLPHLCLDVSRCDLPDFDHAAAHILSPPLRTCEHVEALWGAIRTGVVSIIATDHCAFNREQKRRGKDDFRCIPNGMIGIEERMMILWERGVHVGNITPQKFVSLTSTEAAKVFGCYPRKGVVAVGSDADLVIWDPAVVHTISAQTHHSRVEINPYEGMACHGAPAATVSQGRLAYVRGTGVLAQPGTGRFIKRARVLLN